jgi:hypothetical protein
MPDGSKIKKKMDDVLNDPKMYSALSHSQGAKKYI